MDYMIDKATNLSDLRLYGANLVTNDKWSELFRARGYTLKTLKLRWLDASFEDKQVADLVRYCPNLECLKLEVIQRIGLEALKSVSKLKNLEHLSLRMHPSVTIPNNILIQLIKSLGPKLRTLSLREFPLLDDSVLKQIHTSCRNLAKLRITVTDVAADAGFAALFTNWENPPLHFVDFSSTRDIDNQNPDGPEDEPIGLGIAGFAALMKHSGLKLRRLDISSCRHIPLQTLLDIFTAPSASFPLLERVNLSFVRVVDDVVLAGLFRAAVGSLKRVELFGCFNVGSGVVVPQGVVIVGAPRLELQDGGMEVHGAGVPVHGTVGEEWEDGASEAFLRKMEEELDEMDIE